jgi:hypothetical protein
MPKRLIDLTASGVPNGSLVNQTDRHGSNWGVIGVIRVRRQKKTSNDQPCNIFGVEARRKSRFNLGEPQVLNSHEKPNSTALGRSRRPWLKPAALA